MPPVNTLDAKGDEYQTALLLSASRIDELAKGLERTWVAQLLLAAIGVALIMDIGGFQQVLARYFAQEDPNLKVASGVILLVTIYFFMRFGQLLSVFLRVRRLHEKLLDNFHQNSRLHFDLGPLKASSSYFEGYYSSDLFGGQKPVVVMYYILTCAALSVSQAASLYLIYHSYGLNLWSGTLIAAASLGLILLYIGFWRAKRSDHPQTTLFIVACIAMIAFWCVVFFFAAKNDDLRVNQRLEPASLQGAQASNPVAQALVTCRTSLDPLFLEDDFRFGG